MNRRVRPLAVCLFSEGGRILVAECWDSVSHVHFYRPLGGGIEFGETGAEAIVREIREELTAEVRDLRYLGAVENLYQYEGRPGHEIVMVYDGRFADESLYAMEELSGVEEDGFPFRALWIDPQNPPKQGAAVVPANLMALLSMTPLMSGGGA